MFQYAGTTLVQFLIRHRIGFVGTHAVPLRNQFLEIHIFILGSSIAFGVNWGDPLGATLIVLLFCLVGAGAGMLLGSVFNTDQQAASMAMLFGLGLAALGGSMAPLEIFPDVMRTIAHFTPHAWGNDAFAELVRRGGGVADILTELGALAAFAVVLLSLATWRLRKAITS